MDTLDLLQFKGELEALKKESLNDTFKTLSPYRGKNLSERIDNLMFTFNIDTSEDFTALENYQYTAGYQAGLEIVIDMLHKLLIK